MGPLKLSKGNVNVIVTRPFLLLVKVTFPNGWIHANTFKGLISQSGKAEHLLIKVLKHCSYHTLSVRGDVNIHQ